MQIQSAHFMFVTTAENLYKTGERNIHVVHVSTKVLFSTSSASEFLLKACLMLNDQRQKHKVHDDASRLLNVLTIFFLQFSESSSLTAENPRKKFVEQTKYILNFLL